MPPIAVVPLRRWDAVSLKALRLAISLTQDVVVLQVVTDDGAIDDLSNRWATLAIEPARTLGIKPPKLVVRTSEYRQLFAPLIDFVASVAREHPNRQVAVIVPQLVEGPWYYAFLHAHNASILKAVLLMKGGPQVVIVNIPWYLRDWRPERRRLFSSRKADVSPRTLL
jgi:hypothetical protein